MDYLWLLLTAAASLLVLFILTKWIGNRQVSQMTMFDYVVGITVGSIAAEMATELEEPLKPLTAMVVYAALSVLISKLSSRYLKVRSVVNSRPLLLLENGILYRENFKKANLDLSEFLTYCRMQGYFDLGQIQTALLEHNGVVSILPKTANRPASPQDLGQTPQQEEVWLPVVIDGEVVPQNLQQQNRTEEWLYFSIRAAGYPEPAPLMLVLCDSKGILQIFPRG